MATQNLKCNLSLLLAFLSVLNGCTGKDYAKKPENNASTPAAPVTYSTYIDPFDTIINELKIHIEQIDTNICLSINGKEGYACGRCHLTKIYDQKYSIREKGILVFNKAKFYRTNIFVMDSMLIYSLIDFKSRTNLYGVQLGKDSCHSFSPRKSYEEREAIFGEFNEALLLPERRMIIEHGSVWPDSNEVSYRGVCLYKILKDRFQFIKYIDVYERDLGDCFWIDSEKDYEKFYRKILTNKKFASFLK